MVPRALVIAILATGCITHFEETPHKPKPPTTDVAGSDMDGMGTVLISCFGLLAVMVLVFATQGDK